MTTTGPPEEPEPRGQRPPARPPNGPTPPPGPRYAPGGPQAPYPAQRPPYPPVRGSQPPPGRAPQPGGYPSGWYAPPRPAQQGPYPGYPPVYRPPNPGGDPTAPLSPQPGSWPQYWAEPPADRSGGGIARACLVIAALCSLGYAVWAFTARRGIFADFSAGRSVTIDDARASDRIDTALLIVAGVALVGALVTWVVRRARRQTSGGRDLAGLALVVVGAVIVGLGLWLDSDVTSAATRALMGDRGAAAAVVTGAGFVVVAVGLLVCSTAVRGSRTSIARQPELAYRAPGRPWAS